MTYKGRSDTVRDDSWYIRDWRARWGCKDSSGKEQETSLAQGQYLFLLKKNLPLQLHSASTSSVSGLVPSCCSSTPSTSKSTTKAAATKEPARHSKRLSIEFPFFSPCGTSRTEQDTIQTWVATLPSEDFVDFPVFSSCSLRLKSCMLHHATCSAFYAILVIIQVLLDILTWISVLRRCCQRKTWIYHNSSWVPEGPPLHYHRCFGLPLQGPLSPPLSLLCHLKIIKRITPPWGTPKSHLFSCSLIQDLRCCHM